MSTTRWQKAVDLVMRAMITDKLKSYGSAKREIMPGVEHRQHKGLNNRPGCPNLRRHHRPGHRCLTGCPNQTRGARPNNLTVPCEPTHKTTEAHGSRVAVVLGDLTVEGDAQNIADSAIEQLGGIDILVNNAGGTGEKLVWEDTPIRAWTESYERNVLAAVRLISRLLLPMRQSGWGRIVNVSSVAGVMPQPTGPDYSARKAAINNLSLSLTKALGSSD